MKKTIFATVLASLVIGAGYLAVNVRAHGFDNRDDLVQRLSQALGKSEEEVAAVFEKIHQERQLEHATAMENKLNQAIADGILTEEQKNSLLEIHQQHLIDRENWRDLDPEERHEKMAAHHQAIEEWAESEGIDVSQIRLAPLGERHGFGEGRGMRYRQN